MDATTVWVSLAVEILGIVGSIIVVVIPLKAQQKRDREKAASDTVKQTEAIKAEIQESKEAAKKSTETLMELVGNMESRINDVYEAVDESKAVEARVRILAFENELAKGETHNHAQFQQAIIDVDYYTAYCEKHEHFPNGIAVAACNRIRKEYERLRDSGQI